MPGLFLRAGETTPQSEFLRRIGIGGRDLLWGDAGTERPELADISTWLNDFRVSSWRSVLQTHGIDDVPLAIRLAEQFPDEMWRRIGPFPEIQSVVRILADRFKLGILTNGMPPHQHRKLAASGVPDAFKAVVTSGGIGIGKPDSPAFTPCSKSVGNLCIRGGNGRRHHGARHRGSGRGRHPRGVDRPEFQHRRRSADLPCARVSSLTELVEIL